MNAPVKISASEFVETTMRSNSYSWCIRPDHGSFGPTRPTVEVLGAAKPSTQATRRE